MPSDGERKEKGYKMTKKIKQLIIPILIITLLIITLLAIINPNTKPNTEPDQAAEFKPEITKSEAEWKQLLSPQQYYVLRQKGTDPAFSETTLLNEHRAGTFVTADCGEPVFRSENKYDSGTGWPSFWKPIDGSVIEIEDNSFELKRVEIVGKKCGGHLGHVFTDGPQPTGLRYCINPSALKFIPD